MMKVTAKLPAKATANAARNGSLRAFHLAIGLSLLTGCAASVEFSGQLESNGVLGKSWQTPYFVDASIYQPGFQTISSTSALVADFDIATYGTSLQLVTSHWDPLTTGTYRGYGRLYQDGVGWSSFGPDFGQIATAGATSIASVTAAADSTGLFMANLFTGASIGASAAYGTEGWELFTNNATLGQVPAGAGSAFSVMDADSNGYVFFADAAGAIRQGAWAYDATNGLDSSFNTVYAGPIRVGSSLTAHFDGANQVCVTYEDTASRLLANCESTSSGGTLDFAAGDAQTLSYDVAGHDTATDGEGGMMAVFYRGTGTTFHVYASVASDGDWPTSVTQIDDQDDGFTAPWPVGVYAIPGARPGVAYVGEGRYLAIWVGIDELASPPATQLYSNLYDPALGGWQGAAAITGTEDSFSATEATPHAQALTVFGNEDGNAGYALNKIYTSDNIGGTHTGSTPAVYPEAAQVRMLEVNRWQVDQGWVGAQTMTQFACFNQYDNTYPWLAETGSGSGTDCTHRPVGVIFPSGNTLVFFQAQDGFSSGNRPGNRRVGVVSFE